MTAELPFDIAKATVPVQERYIRLLAEGQSPRLAEMLALQAAPRIMTDSVYFAGHGNLDKQFGDAPCGMLDKLVEAAKAQGYTPGRNDVYDSNLAPTFGHPLGFIPPTGGRNHFRRAAEHLDVDVFEGPIENRRQKHGDTIGEPCRLAPDLVEETVDEMLRADPELRFKADREDLRREAITKHGFDDSKLTGESLPGIQHPHQVQF